MNGRRRAPDGGEDKAPAPARRRRLGRRRSLMVPVALVVLGAVWAGSRGPAPVPAPPRSARANLLVNGSFEQPAVPRGAMAIYQRPPSWRQRMQLWWRLNWPYRGQLVTPAAPRELFGWRLTRGSVDVTTRGYWQPAPGQGQCSLDLVGTPGAATIEQSFATRPGEEYRFTGWLAHNPQNPVAPMARAQVSLNGRPFVQLLHREPKATRRNMHWRRFSYRFRAPSAVTTLAITDVTGTYPLCGTVLDGLAVTPMRSGAAPGSASRRP
jgi:hypothetical protein